MKKIYITMLIAMVWSSIAIAQVDYTPLVREGVRWTYLASDVSFSFENTGVESYLGKGDYAYFMEFRGDTIINGLTYKKLYSSLSREFDESKLRPVAYLREADKHVYGIPDRTGRFQFAESHNLELPILGKAVFGSDRVWQEYELYDFNDMETFAYEALSDWTYGMDINVEMKTVSINGEIRNAYSFSCRIYDDEYELFNFTIIEGIGNEDGNMLGFGPYLVPTCICPIELGLAQQETVDGNVIYHGQYYYGPYHGDQLIDVDDVNHAINIILGKQIYSRHYFNDISDFNGDYIVDIEDVNAIINRILHIEQ